jgi:glyoxylase-like metal-dependent hydrolase (beta-lactamase superfamily II)
MNRLTIGPRLRLLMPLLAMALVVAVGWAQGPQDATETVEKVTDDIYLVRSTYGNDGNAVIIINEDDVTVVDARVSPARARKLDGIIKNLTPKPVRDLILSHYHHDHSLGTQVFNRPGVQIYGHEYTRYQLLNYNIMEQFTHKFISTTSRLTLREELPKQIAQETDPARKQELEEQLAVNNRWLDEYLVDIKETRQTPPQVTLATKMTLHRGSREIQLLHLGRAHTGGDVFTFLPNERIIITGDMIPAFVYMGDSHVDEWPATLERMLELDFDTVVPGHGTPMPKTEAEKVYRGQAAYLRDLWSATAALKSQGLSAYDAAQKLDLSKHRTGPFQGIPYVGKGGIGERDVRAVARMYEVMDGKREVTD